MKKRLWAIGYQLSAKTISLAVMFMLFILSTAWGDPVELDLQKTVHLAIVRNQAIQSAADTVQAFQAKIIETRSHLEPNVNLFYNFTRDLYPLGPPFVSNFGTFQASPYILNTYQDGVTFTQLLYDGQTSSSLVRQQEALTQASRSDYHLTAQTTAFDAISGFYQLAISRKLVGVGEENLRDADSHFKLAEARYKAGVAPRSDMIFAKVPVANAQLGLTQAEEAAAVAEASLNRLLAYDVTTPIVLKNVSELTYPVTQEQAFRTALENRDEIQKAQHVVAAAKAQLDSAHGGFLPVLNAVAGYDFTDYKSTALPGYPGYNIGVQSTFTIFDGNLQSGRVAEAKALYDKSVVDLDATQQNVLLNVRQSFLAFKSSEQSLKEAQVAEDSALENLHAQEGEYKAGLVPIINLTDAQTSYLQTQTDSLRARLNYQISMAQLLEAMGINLEDLHEIIR